MKHSLAYIIILLHCWSCIYPFDADLTESGTPSIVIDGNIRIGGVSEISLSYVNPLNSVYLDREPDGSVHIEDNRGARYGTERRGRFFSINTEGLDSRRQYRLVAEVDGKTYSSDWQAAIAPPKMPLINIFADKNSVFVSASIDASSSGTGYVALQYSELWNFHADYVKMYDFNLETSSIDKISPDLSHYWCWQKFEMKNDILLDLTSTGGIIDDYIVLSFPREDNRNHRDYNVTVRVRSLSEYEYRYRVLLRDNVLQGASLFSPDPGELSSNISCESDPKEKVYGYVNVFRETAKSDFVDSRYYIQGKNTALALLEPEQYMDFYHRGYSPVADYVSIDGRGIGWGTPRCYDCIAAGGTLEKP